jgi:cell division septation protein DedD
MDDEGVHEFQLHGKQLVFVVMSATVVAVAIFLCGVMVGRGVPAARSDNATQSADATAIEPAPPLSPLPVSPLPDPTTNEGAAADTLEPRYGEILDPPDPVREDVLERPRWSAAPVAAPAPRPEVTTARPARAARAERTEGTVLEGAVLEGAAAAPTRRMPVAPAVSSRDGFVVQVSALKGRSEAETIRRRLESKGYPAFVEAAGAGREAVFRVRVGHYDSRRAAESIAARLEREERFKTWITR